MEAQAAHLQAAVLDLQRQGEAARHALEAARAREQAAAATAEAAQQLQAADAVARVGQVGIDAWLLGKPSGFHGEVEKWSERSLIFRSSALPGRAHGAGGTGPSPSTERRAGDERAGGEPPAALDAPHVVKATSLRIAMQAGRHEGAEAERSSANVLRP